jgi:hypothetical protein
MRYLFGFVCLWALGVMPLVGCSDNEGTGGSGGSGGTGGTEPACQATVCACTEAGIRAAIAEGGGPFTFDCEGPTTVVTEAEIVIDNDVILVTCPVSPDHELVQSCLSSTKVRG